MEVYLAWCATIENSFYMPCCEGDHHFVKYMVIKKANFRKLRTVHLQGKGSIIFFCDFKTLVVSLAIGIVWPPAPLPSLQQFRLLPTFSLLLQFSLAQLYHNGIEMTKDLKVALGLYEVYSKKSSNLLKFTWVSTWVPKNELSAL